MKKQAPSRKRRAIRVNCTVPALPPEVQDLADLLADIAEQQIRAQQTQKNGGSPE